MSSRPALTAWQRWEMAAFAPPANEPTGAPAPAAPADANEPVPPVASVHVPDEALLQRLRDEAREAGAAEGRAQGLVQGRMEGRQEGLADMQAQGAQLLALAEALPAALRGAEEALARSLLALVLDVARQLAGAALKADPECVLAVVRDLLATEPALAGAPRLHLHPDDAALVREQLGPELREAGWTLQPDAQLARGGCIVRAASGELDGTVETRWQRVEAALACRLPAEGPAHA